MKIELIVPVIVDHLFQGFLESVEANTILPQRILLIDNTPKGIKPKSTKVEIVRLKSKTGMVNESWNLGIKRLSKDCEAVGIYNDDIILNPYFFQRTIETLNWSKQCAVACPNTVETTQSLRRGRVNRTGMTEREGWCFTIKKQILDLIPPIPDNVVQTFCGDSWIFEHTQSMGYFWGKDLGNPIWHYKGVSILATGKRKDKKPEWNSWQQLRTTIP
jgi:hypothetical protein